MKHIQKGPEPQSLRAYRSTPDATYGGFQGKDELRKSLVAEQGGICCYCMQRIHPEVDKMKVEHWNPQGSGKDLAYQNLLGACMGREGEPKHLQHCDTRKGNTLLRLLDPISKSPNCEDLVKYRKDGKIVPGNKYQEEVKKELVETLNLNNQRLTQNRAKAIDAAIDIIQKYSSKKEKVRQALKKWESKNSRGYYQPYCQVVIYFLKRFLKKNP